jgi:hypothetical protein
VTDDDPPRTGDERSTLLFFLAWQRATLMRKCAGLDDHQLRLRSAAPSTLSLLGLVRHMSDGEVQWFRQTLAGEDAAFHYSTDANANGDFDDVDTADVAETLGY